MRSVGSEVGSVLLVLAVPLGVAAVFPFGAFGFRAAASDTAVRPAGAAFVSLGAAEEAEAVRRAKTSWHGAGEGGVRPNLLEDNLPEPPRNPVLSVEARTHPPEPAPVLPDLPPFLPTQAAAAPAQLPAAPPQTSLPFPRGDLLRLR